MDDSITGRDILVVMGKLGLSAAAAIGVLGLSAWVGLREAQQQEEEATRFRWTDKNRWE